MNPNLPVIVGESNPYGSDPYYALYPEPVGCAGWRLCHKVMGLRIGTYLSSFERVNLLRGQSWSAPRAREAAALEFYQYRTNQKLILLGSNVTKAFSLERFAPPQIIEFRGHIFLVLPHPSGRNRMWSSKTVQKNCRELLRQFLPDIPFGEVDHLPLPKDLPHLFEPVPVPNVFVDLKFTWCRSCTSEPDYRGPCDCTHAPCVHSLDPAPSARPDLSITGEGMVTPRGRGGV